MPMKRGLGFKLIAALLIYANLLPPSLLLAQTSKPAGVVSALKGEVVITRVALPQQPVSLKFKDEVFFRDRITTKEQSIVRVLMGGKALITVRELSELTITEEPGKPSLVDLAKGKIGLAVARVRMSPGESIEVRTPNAVAAVRGTVIVVEVLPIAGQAALDLAADTPDYQPVRAGPARAGEAVPVQAPTVVTNFHVIQGSIEVLSLAQPGAPPITVGAGLSVSVVGGTIGQPRPSPSNVGQGYAAPRQHSDTPEETQKDVSAKQEKTAIALAEALAPKPEAKETPKEEPQAQPKEEAQAEASTTTATTTTTTTSTTNVVLPTTGCEPNCPGTEIPAETTTLTIPPNHTVSVPETFSTLTMSGGLIDGTDSLTLTGTGTASGTNTISTAFNNDGTTAVQISQG